MNDSVLKLRKVGPNILLNSDSAGLDRLANIEEMERLLQKVVKENRNILTIIQKDQYHVTDVERGLQ